MDIKLKVSFHTGFLFIFFQSILRAILDALRSFGTLGHKWTERWLGRKREDKRGQNEYIYTLFSNAGVNKGEKAKNELKHKNIIQKHKKMIENS